MGLKESERAQQAICPACPNTVREKLVGYNDLAGFSNFRTRTQVGTMPNAMARERCCGGGGGHSIFPGQGA